MSEASWRNKPISQLTDEELREVREWIDRNSYAGESPFAVLAIHLETLRAAHELEAMRRSGGKVQ